MRPGMLESSPERFPGATWGPRPRTRTDKHGIPPACMLGSESTILPRDRCAYRTVVSIPFTCFSTVACEARANIAAAHNAPSGPAVPQPRLVRVPHGGTAQYPRILLRALKDRTLACQMSRNDGPHRRGETRGWCLPSKRRRLGYEASP